MPAKPSATRIAKQKAGSSPYHSLVRHLLSARTFNRIPMFVLGSGISRGIVPLLSEMAWWFQDRLRTEDLPSDYLWVRQHAEAINTNKASRREAAEFFSAIQGPALKHVWADFSKGLLRDGLQLADRKFSGLYGTDVHPSPAHFHLADLLRSKEAYVISLNFDGLTHRALTTNQRTGLVLHSTSEISNYFTAPTTAFSPAVIKVRGDVFYAKCRNSACSLSQTPYPLDRLSRGADNSICCPSCRDSELQLQFQFPGYREKEEAAYPMLWAARKYLGSRVSAIVVIGLSGRWDRYMLQFMFDFAKERSMVIADVKPSGDAENLIDDFRSQYYPSVPHLDGQSPVAASYVRIEMSADEFLGKIHEELGYTKPTT